MKVKKQFIRMSGDSEIWKVKDINEFLAETGLLPGKYMKDSSPECELFHTEFTAAKVKLYNHLDPDNNYLLKEDLLC